MIKKIMIPFASFGFALSIPLISRAQVAVPTLFSLQTEAILGLGLVIISIIASIYAIKLARLFGGALGSTWRMLAAVASLYGLFQIFLSLEEFGIIEFAGFDEVLEILIAVFLLAAFYKGYRVLKGQMTKQ